MSNSEARKLQQTKYDNVLQESVTKVDEAVKKLCAETDAVLFAEIQQVGQAQIKVRIKAPPLSRIWFIRNRQMKKINNRVEAFNFRYKTICDENGVVSLAKITEYGALIFYILNQEKAKELENIIVPVETPKKLIIP